MDNLNTLTKKVIICNDYNFARRQIIKLNLEDIDIINYSVKKINDLLKEEINDRFITNKEASLIIYHLIQTNGYGFNQQLMSEGASLKLLEVLNDFRLLLNPTFLGLKEASYFELINDFEQYLKMNHLTDYYLALKDFKTNNYLNIECFILDDLILAPLEEKVLKETFKKINYLNNKATDFKIKGLYNCYGIYNEIMNVLKIIEEEKLNTADCTILVPNNDYENLLIAEFDSNKIPYSYSSYHLRCSDVITFLIDVMDYLESDYQFSYLEKVINNPTLNDALVSEFYQTFSERIDQVGFGKERTNKFNDALKLKNENNIKKEKDAPYLNLTKFIDDLLFLDVSPFDINQLATFSFTYLKNQDQNFKEFLMQSFNKINNYYKLSKAPNTLLREELEKLVLNNVSDNKLSIERINYSFTNKNHLFVLGMTQLNLSGALIENSFIEDVELFKGALKDNPKCHIAELRKNDIIKKLDYYLRHSRSNIYLSTYDFNKITLRPSSLSVYLLKLKNEFNLAFEDVNLYPIINNKVIAFNKIPTFEEAKIKKEELDYNLYISPSAIQTLASCVYHFYYQNFLNLPNVQYPTLSEVSWLDVNAKGTFFHEILEHYATAALKAENFQKELNLDIFEEAFNEAHMNALKANVIKSEAIYHQDLKEIKAKALDYTKKIIKKDFKGPYFVLATEFNLRGLNYFIQGKTKKIGLSGIVDRIDGAIIDGVLHLRVVDYKTGRYKDRQESVYLQHIYYPYVLEHTNELLFGLTYDKVIIDEFIYDYPFSNKKNAYNNSEIKEEYARLEELFNLVLNYYEQNPHIYQMLEDFQAEIDAKRKKDVCEYCTYQNICYRKLVELDEKEEQKDENDA